MKKREVSTIELPKNFSLVIPSPILMSNEGLYCSIVSTVIKQCRYDMIDAIESAVWSTKTPSQTKNESNNQAKVIAAKVMEIFEEKFGKDFFSETRIKLEIADQDR